MKNALDPDTSPQTNPHYRIPIEYIYIFFLTATVFCWITSVRLIFISLFSYCSILSTAKTQRVPMASTEAHGLSVYTYGCVVGAAIFG